MPKLPIVPDIVSEFKDATFGDARLSKRLESLVLTASKSSGQSFPRMVGSDGELEGIYRFLSNERVSMERILAPHIEATRQRGMGVETLVVHDTTGFTFRGGGHRKGLGRLSRSGSAQSQEGFFGHFAFAVAGDGTEMPLGVLGLTTFTRGELLPGPRTAKKYLELENKESSRWPELALTVARELPEAIHVMDREGDSYEILRTLTKWHLRFVIRGRTGWGRRGARNGRLGSLPELVNQTPIRMTRSVRIARRAPRKVGVLHVANPPRDARDVDLSIRAATITLQRPARFGRSRPFQDPVTINVVMVEEVSPPAGAEPVSWMLMTSEPIGSRADIAKVVDTYCTRWVIEEFFKALKTGCAFEKRQLESLSALENALAVFSVIAWRLLLLRTLARVAPKSSATAVATKRQIALLQTLPEVAPRFRDIDVGNHPTTTDVLFAIAKLGGHLKRNGTPGWQVLGRGYDTMLILELGWIARDRSDQ